MMFKSLSFLALLATGATSALACTEDYVALKEDTLFSIAKTRLGSAAAWSEIAALNPAFAEGELDLRPGQTLTLPCADEIVARAAFEDVAPPPRDMIRIVTGTDYAPFTDLDWPAQGMLTEIVNAALARAPSALPYRVEWENDWSRHLYPLVDEAQVDMSFPWFRPDCAATPDHARCTDFNFSEPLVDLVILLFAKTESGLVFERDRDIVGRTLCRPAGYFTHDLDRPDRKWLSQGLVELKQPDTPAECFALLMAGEVDAVAMNEFLGIQTMFELGIGAEVAPLLRPLSEEALHVVISKSHWRGTAHLYRFNAGLRALKSSAEYNEIVNRHLAHFWETIEKG